MADIILEEQDGQDHVYNGVRVLSARNASGSGRTNFLEQNGTVVTSVNGKFGDVEITQEDIPDNSLFTIKEIVDSLPAGSYSYNEDDGYYEFTQGFDYEFKGSKDYFTMLLGMDAMFIGKEEHWVEEEPSQAAPGEGYVALKPLAGTVGHLTPQEIPIPPARNAWIKNVDNRSWHVETERPHFTYYTSNSSNVSEEKQDFISHRCGIKSNVDFSLNQLRVVCPREQFVWCKISVTIPDGSKLRIKSFFNQYEKKVPKEDSAFRYDSHFGKFFPDTNSKFQNTKKSYRFASLAGFTGCVCTPQITANNVIVCTHNESVPSLTQQSEITIGNGKYSVTPYYINTEMTYNISDEDFLNSGHVTGQTYAPGDLVSYNNGKYVKIIEKSNVAPTDESQWTEIYTIKTLRTDTTSPFYKGDCVLYDEEFYYCEGYTNNFSDLKKVVENPSTVSTGKYVKLEDKIYLVTSTSSSSRAVKAILKICDNTVIPATDLLFWDFGEKDSKIPTFEEFLQVCAATGMSPVLSLHVASKNTTGNKSVYRTVWKQQQDYSEGGGDVAETQGMYWNPNSADSEIDTIVNHCFNSYSRKSWTKNNNGEWEEDASYQIMGANYAKKYSSWTPQGAGIQAEEGLKCRNSVLEKSWESVESSGNYVWRQQQTYDETIIDDYGSDSRNWFPDEDTSWGATGKYYYNSLSQKTWEKENAEYYWYKKENLQKLKDLLDKYNLTSKVNIKSWGIDVVEFAYQIFGTDVEGYTIEEMHPQKVSEPFRSISNLCNVCIEQSSSWIYTNINKQQINKSLKDGKFLCTCLTTEEKLGNSTALKKLGVSRILSDNNLNNGIE